MKSAIAVKNVYKRFKLPHEKVSTVKGFFVSGLLKYKKIKSYELQHVLEDISIDIKEGEFVGIVGRNGSGKSTLLKILAGIYQPTSGSVAIHGKLVPFIELGVGFNPELTGRQNIYLNGALLNFSKKEIDDMYQDIVDFAELERFMDQKLKNYSSGMQVRLSFSLAIQAKADILLIDEVLAVGDADFQRKCFNYFKQLKKQKATVILVSHDMNAIREYCDRAILIEKGVVQAEGDPEKIAQKYTKLFNTQEVSGGQTDNSKRWGDGSVRLERVEASLLANSKKVELRIQAVAKKDIEDPSFGFQIKTADNSPVMGTNMKIKHHKIGLVKKGQHIEVAWSFPNILSDGQHFVTVAATHSDDIRVCDWWEDATTITIFRDEATPYNVAPEINVKSSVK